jgi:16S rRNA (guanine527-N7)-methyltransferase
MAATSVVDSRFETGARLFLEELEAWAQVTRLTGYETEAARVEHLLLDSLLWLPALPVVPSPLVDLGTGAGIPGVVLKLARPDLEVWFVEANRRRANFVRQVHRRLGWDPTGVYHGRAEELGAGPLASRAAVVTMRAVAAPALAARLARPFLRPEGHLVVPLGPGARVSGPRAGRLVEVEPPGMPGTLPRRRRFLIMATPELEAIVSRGTPGGRDARPGRRQPEGRGRQDHDRGQPGRRPGRR